MSRSTQNLVLAVVAVICILITILTFIAVATS